MVRPPAAPIDQRPPGGSERKGSRGSVTGGTVTRGNVTGGRVTGGNVAGGKVTGGTSVGGRVTAGTLAGGRVSGTSGTGVVGVVIGPRGTVSGVSG
jgi:hypothetical protein